MSTEVRSTSLLLDPNYKDFGIEMLTFVHASKVSCVCKSLQELNRLAMKKMWREGIALLTKVDPIPINREHYSESELSAIDKKEKVKNALTDRMLAIVPEKDKTTLKNDVVGCYRRLLEAQREVVYGSTLQPQIVAFKAIQQRYQREGSSFSFERFIENEEVIDSTKRKMDKNLEVVWPRILRGLHQALPNQVLPNSSLQAAAIRAWQADARNQAVLNTLNLELRLVAVGGLIGKRFVWLAGFPKEVCLFRRLKELDISHNHLKALPTAFGTLDHLEKLHLNNNDFTTVPLEIARLRNLETLYLNNNQLSDLPPSLTSLTRLHWLHLGHNQFTVFPSVIGSLTSIDSLYLGENQLNDVPIELSNLPRLDSLHLEKNRFTEIPQVIGRMSALQILNLSGNQISNVSIRLSDNLRYLYLHNNQLTEIPSWISDLRQLSTLELSNNQIGELPAFITNAGDASFNGVYSVFVAGNPIRSIGCLLGDVIQGVDMTQVEEMAIPFQEWFESCFTMSTDAGDRFIDSIFTAFDAIGDEMRSLLSNGRSRLFRVIVSVTLLPPLLFIAWPLLFLFAHLSNLIAPSFITAINAIARHIMAPIVGFFRGLLGYPPTVMTRLI